LNIAVDIPNMFSWGVRFRRGHMVKSPQRARVRKGVMPFTFFLVLPFDAEETLRGASALASPVFGSVGTAESVFQGLVWTPAMGADDQGTQAVASFDGVSKAEAP
jgi:hypothetical protein